MGVHIFKYKGRGTNILKYMDQGVGNKKGGIQIHRNSPKGRNSATGVDWPQYRVLTTIHSNGLQNVPKRAACTGRARAHFSKILCNLHSLYARETTKARLRVMITRAQHSFGTLLPGVMFQTFPFSSHVLEGLGTRLIVLDHPSIINMG